MQRWKAGSRDEKGHNEKENRGGDQGSAAAAALAEALHAFDHGNDKLEKALELAKQN